jgi:hypothetical protein
MFTLIGANLPDNTSGMITPEKIREVTTQLADSMLYAAAGVKEVELLRAASTVTQAPSATDTPLQLSFGAAQYSAINAVMINSAGLVTFNQAGNYAVRIKTQNGRTGASGTSILLMRILVDGVQRGYSAATKITAAESTVPTESRVVVDATAGQTMVVQVMRDSAGSNFGGVYPQSSTVPGWGMAPSAFIVISRLEPV